MALLQSKAVYGNGYSITGCSVMVYWTGTINFYLGLSNSAATAPIIWEEVTGLNSGIAKRFTFSTSTGKWLFHRAVLDIGAKIYVPTNDYGRPIAPAIKLYDFLEES